MVKSIDKGSKEKISTKKPLIKLKMAKCFRNTLDQTNSSTEEDKPNPVNIYGKTKLESEKFIKDYALKRIIDAISLRYFNPVASHEDFLIIAKIKEYTPLYILNLHMKAYVIFS